MSWAGQIGIGGILGALLLVAVPLVGRPRRDDLPLDPRLLATGGILLAAIAAAAHALAGDTRTRTLGIAAAVLLASSPAPALLASALARTTAVRRTRAAGVLAWGAEALDRAARTGTLVLDKAGTVTTGDLRVVSVDPFDRADDRNLRWFAGALSHALPTPMGRAVSRLATTGRLTAVEELPGQGISGCVDRHPVRVGRPDWLAVPAPRHEGMAIAVEVDGRPFGTITVDDVLRAEAAAGVGALHDLGLRTVLVSDDTEARTVAAARAAGIVRALGEVGADAQARLVEQLRAEGTEVAAVARYDEGGALAAADLALSDGWPDRPPPQGIALADLDVARLRTIFEQARRAVARAREGALIGTGTAALAGLAGAFGTVTPMASALIAVGCGALVAGVVLRPFPAARRSAEP
jgi:cation transport ATPase